jgi:hypothetical protein
MTAVAERPVTKILAAVAGFFVGIRRGWAVLAWPCLGFFRKSEPVVMEGEDHSASVVVLILIIVVVIIVMTIVVMIFVLIMVIIIFMIRSRGSLLQ